MKKLLLLASLPLLVFISLGLIGIIEASFQTGRRYALIINTWNDFPQEKAYDVDAFPAQALQAYLVLKDKGYTDDEIYLMIYHSNDSFVDVDGDGINDLQKASIDVENDFVIKENLKAAIEGFSGCVGQYDEVMIFLIGHSQRMDGNLSAFSFENGDLVTHEELLKWLKKINCKQMIFFLDFCFSGNFAKPLIESGRVIVCASEDNKMSWDYWNWGHLLNKTERMIFGNAGSAFFHPFWNKLGEGATLQEAFEYGKEECFRWSFIDPKSKNVTQTQNPQMYVKERTIWENFVFFFPGGPIGLLIATTVVVLVESAILAAAVGAIRSSYAILN